MDKKEFKEYCEEHDDNLVTKWDYKKFKLICQKCKSLNVKVVDNIKYHQGSGCFTCGYESYTTGNIIVKCCDCGQAMQVLAMEDLDG